MKIQKKIVLLQSRVGSTRLPGKALLNLKGMPLSIVAAKRAANKGCKVILVTSNDRSDDVLVDACKHYNVEYYRGNLNNVLQRFISALSDFPDDTIVTRLTADNLIPDGLFIEEMQQHFVADGCHYMTTFGQKSGLPYGVSAETFFLKDLREIDLEKISNMDKEHVTPYLRRKFGLRVFDKYQNLEMSNYRATIDCLDDYINLSAIFRFTESIIDVSWIELVHRLKSAPVRPEAYKIGTKMVLGGAQLGMKYGVTRVDFPSRQDRESLVKTAITNGVSMIDTARSYEESESVIGSVLNKGWRGRVKIITKLSPLSEFTEKHSKSEVACAAENSVLKSCIEMQVKKIDILALHRSKHLLGWEGAVWQKMLDLQENDRIGTLGVSVQTPAELFDVLDVEEIGYVQFPFNILDNRWSEAIKKLVKIRDRREIIVHVRSVLLQGLIVSTDASLWKRANVDNSSNIISWLDLKKIEFNQKSTLELALNWVRSQPWIDGVVLGVENNNQLIENLEIFDKEGLSSEQSEILVNDRPNISEITLNPALWSKI